MSNKKYLAKSNGETIQEHTNKLLEKFEDLNNLYPQIFKSSLIKYMLYNSCLYHDIGKINNDFQNMIIENGKRTTIPHGLLSIAFLDKVKFTNKIGDILNLNEEREILNKRFGTILEKEKYLYILTSTIAYHHERNMNAISEEELKEAILKLAEIKNFHYEKIDFPEKLKLPGKKYFDLDRRIPHSDESVKYEASLLMYILIKGLLNKIDYCASSEIDNDIEIKNDFLEVSLSNLLESWKEKNSEATWNELQNFMIENRDENVISIAQTGMGKTEAGLLWIGNHKGFFVLPIRTAINAIYKRIVEDIVNEGDIQKVGLLHSETLEQYLNIYNEIEGESLNKYYMETKQLSLPLTVCTLDQLFDFVYMYGGSEVKLATLSYSKVVLDEIQMYSPDLTAYIIIGLESITKMGGKFAILTATFPPFIEDFLRMKKINFKKSKFYIKENLKLRHTIKLIENTIDMEDILKKYNHNKILVICNTIKEAQKIYDDLKERIDENEINLFHSKFIRKDRENKEKEILEIGNKNSKKYGISIATQVVEASLDIDFDLLFTELSDLNGLFQRMGRCYRNRKYDEKYKYNCYVYIGNEKKSCSGVGKVIDKDIHRLSRELLIEKFQNKANKEEEKRKIYEDEKMGYVEELYSTENLKETEYYKQILLNIEYIGVIAPFEIEKAEAKKKFRDISSLPIIPENVYQENKNIIKTLLFEIEEIKEKLSRNINLSQKEKIELRLEIRKKKNEIKNFSLNLQISYYEKNFNIVKKIKLDKYQTLNVCTCDYSEEYGLKAIQKIEKWDSDNLI